jgi:uncharacterized protein DUF4169
MGDLINLRTARKRTQRKREEAQAATNRLAHGQPKQQRELAAAQEAKASHLLDGHRIDKGDRR